MKAKAPSNIKLRHLPYLRNVHSGLLESSIPHVKSIVKLILMICLVSKMSLTLAASSGFVWTGGTCCGQNQPQFIHDPAALVNYFHTTPPPNTYPGAYTTCLAFPTAMGQSCYVYAWWTYIDYTSEAECPVEPLTPLDPAVQPYEDGLVDMENETQATRDGAACIIRCARAHRPRINANIVSGYRPQAYQTHIREVYDKWQLLENNSDAACADIKNQVKTEFDRHVPFAHQPGNTSRHSTGLAVDISLTNYADADTLATGCAVTGGGTMSRPVAGDRSHFESPR